MAASSQGNLAERENDIKSLVDQNEREEAGKLLYDLIVSCAQKGDMKNANRLRDWFYEVNPMALGDIIKVNELIEEAMSSSINDKFLQAWAGLKQNLTEEEFNSLYHCLEEHQVEAGKQIVKAGSKLDAIILITSGNVNVNCLAGGKTVTVKVLEAGTMISENCFEPSFWTASLVTISPVTLSILRSEQLMDLYNNFPGIETKLTGYYEQFNDIRTLLQDQGVDRRKHERYTVDHKITFQTIDKDGKPGDRVFKGELDSISKGGLAFCLRIVKRENRRMLFGRRLLVTVEHVEKKYEYTGTVVAVTIHDFQDHDYSVHLAFDNEVADDHVTPLVPSEEEEGQWVPEEFRDEEPGEEEEEQ